MARISSFSAINLYKAVFCLFIVMIISLPAQAQNKFDKLTDGNIRFFIEDLTNITSGVDLSADSGRIAAFLNRHLHPDARFKSEMQYKIPGFPAQSNSVALSKEDFIENIQSGSQVLENYQNETQILKINISKDKSKATILTQGRETGMMQVDGQAMPVQGTSNCQQIIMLNEKGVIQMYNANCKTIISFQDY